jgi:hypothetical protein
MLRIRFNVLGLPNQNGWTILGYFRLPFEIEVSVIRSINAVSVATAVDEACAALGDPVVVVLENRISSG